jgi:hypothetical protein
MKSSEDVLSTQADLKIREARLRRLAARNDLQLVKSRCRTPEAYEYGGYMLVDPFINAVVFGAYPLAFCLDLNDVEAWLNDVA